MEIIREQPLIENVFDNDVIIVPMGINNSFYNGFLREIALNFPNTIQADAKTPYGDKRKYGTIVVCEDSGIAFCLAYISNSGYRKHLDKKGVIDLNALENALKLISNKFKSKKIAFPLIYGTENDGILSIIEKSLPNCVVYEYEQRDFAHEIFKEIAALRKRAMDKEIDSAEYTKIRSAIEWKRKNGIYKPVPDDYVYIPKNNKFKDVVKLHGEKEDN